MAGRKFQTLGEYVRFLEAEILILSSSVDSDELSEAETSGIITGYSRVILALKEFISVGDENFGG
jgi:hypothetical protein